MGCFGVHVSCAGGLLKAVERAAEVGCDCMQIFVCSPRQWPSKESCIPVSLSTKNNNQWKAKPITDDEANLFREKLADLKIVRPLAHASYLLNLASPSKELWDKSLEALIIEWQRAEQLGLDGVVIHPGSHLERSAEEGLASIAEGLCRAVEVVKPKVSWILLENTAGQGTNLGWKIEHLGWLLEQTGASMQIGICIDTCHAHAAGYDLSTAAGLKQLVNDCKSTGILSSIRAIHLNDSKRESGSRIDRHEHIGHGTITESGFARFLQHASFKKLPMYLETAKDEAPDGRNWDVVNLETLRRLATTKLSATA